MRSSTRPRQVREALLYLALPLSLLFVTSLRFGFVGPLSSLWSAAFLAITAVCWLGDPVVPSRLRGFVVFYGLFLAWGWGSLLWAGLNTVALQNLVIFTGFYCGLLCFSGGAATLLARSSRVASVISITSATVFFGSRLLLGARDGDIFLYRPYALVTSILLAWTAAALRFEPAGRGRRLYVIATLSSLATVVATGSRTATAISLVICALVASIGTDGRLRLGRVTALGVAAVLGFTLLITRIDVFRERPGNNVVEVRGVQINASGRLSMWEQTLQSWGTSPRTRLFGQGAGSVSETMRRNRPGTGLPGQTLVHPHNEYLRLLHDFGAIGLGLWGCAMASLLVPLLRDTLRPVGSAGRNLDQPRLLALTALTVLLAACLFLNPLVYIFVMAPLAIALGIAYYEPQPRPTP